MANTGAVWGIDIGQSAIKALRCRPHESDDNRIVVEAFDYIEYPKLLSQPDAEPEELVREALDTFLERNEVKGDSVAMSVPGQSGLARFIKLPPVESKKIPDIVKYEARQQIPFQLEDVVWDYQPLAGGSQDEGYALETEIGLFAMKRDQVSRALEPMTRAGIEIDYIQLAPLALYNYACFDRLGDLEETPFDPENPPPSIVVLSLGVDTTDLVITNGYRVWQRNIQIGGSHFTKALTKELKLTFAKAEHLKKNATKAEDPKAIFQAMRPVFSDLVAEIQRSIGFFQSNNRGAELSEVVAVGNAMQLPGLQRYLSQNLDIPVKLAEEYEALVGGSVTATPAFKQNRLSFPVAYGLCVQALDRGQMSTNLLPDEIVTERIIKAKKPWVAAAAAVLMLGLAMNYSSHVSALQTVDVEDDWSSQISQSKQLATQFNGYNTKNSALISKFEEIGKIGENLASNIDGRLLWPELWKALARAIPQDTRPEAERQATKEDVEAREEVHITSVDCQKYDDLSEWFGTVKTLWDDAEELRAERAAGEEQPEAAGEEGEASAEAFGAEPPGGEGGDDAGPSGEGWVVQLVGHHFHNARGAVIGQDFVRQSLIESLLNGSVELPDGPDNGMVTVTFAELGISHPVVITKNKVVETEYDPNAADNGPAAGGRRRGGEAGIGSRPATRRRAADDEDDEDDEPKTWKLGRYDFTVQFAWTPTPRHARQEAREAVATEASTDESFE